MWLILRDMDKVYVSGERIHMKYRTSTSPGALEGHETAGC